MTDSARRAVEQANKTYVKDMGPFRGKNELPILHGQQYAPNQWNKGLLEDVYRPKLPRADAEGMIPTDVQLLEQSKAIRREINPLLRENPAAPYSASELARRGLARLNVQTGMLPQATDLRLPRSILGYKYS